MEVYLDDILVHADTKEGHNALLQAILRRLEDNGFHLKAAKCAIPCSEVVFLGCRIQGGKLPSDALERAGNFGFRVSNHRKSMATFSRDD